MNERDKISGMNLWRNLKSSKGCGHTGRRRTTTTKETNVLYKQSK
jgi:hypothetical protein